MIDSKIAADLELRTLVRRLDREHLWHPYTEMGTYISTGEPLVIARAEGSRMYDLDGRVFIDGNASWWTALLGHGHPRLVAALIDQARKMAHVPLAGIVHEPAARLAAELVQVAPPGLTRAFFSDDGSTSVEVAVKLAVQYFYQNGAPERCRFISMDGAFHGETLAPTSLSGVDAFRHPFLRIVHESIRIPFAEDGSLVAFEALEQALERHGNEVAAVVLEPIVQGAGGMRIYDPQLLKRARELTRQAGVLLVFDEVFTGYGRTGPMWASDLADVAPDVLCTAKGFSGGMLPMACTLTTEEIFAGFCGDRTRAFLYGHTYCGNPLGAAVAREVLKVYQDEQILLACQPKAARIARAFLGLSDVPGVRHVRSLGMLGAVEFEGGGGYHAGLGRRVCEAALRRGAYVRPLGNVVYVCPALNIEDRDLDLLLAAVSDSVRETVAENP